MSDGRAGAQGNGRTFQRALVVSAHPDDPEFLFGAAVASLVRDGTAVRYVVCSDGANGSRDTSASREEIIAARYSEQRAAARELGVEDVAFLGFPDGRLSPTEELRTAIAREIRAFRPGLVITHFPRRALDIPVEASHPDHIAVGEAALSAVFPDAANARACPGLLGEGLLPHRVEEIWVAGYESANHFIDASALIERKVAAILCHRSQLDGAPSGEAPPWVYWWMRRSGQRVGCEYAEDFKRIVM
jgi:LmbE family N-acetylglucosaminyl deacetylase